MLLLRFLFLYSLFLMSANAQEKNDILDAYYQTMLDTSSFYYELEVVTKEDYVKKILDDDLTLDNVIEADPTEEKGGLSSDVVNQKKLEESDFFSNLNDNKIQKSQIVVYRELKESSYVSVVKLLKLDAKSDVRNQGKQISVSREMIVSSYKSSKENTAYIPFMVNNFDINYLDYFLIYYNHYNFDLIKVTSDNFFYKGTLKDKEEDLFQEIQVKFSKKYNIPTKIILKNPKDRTSINIEVKNVEKVGELYTGTKFSIYDNGKKITLSAYNVSVGIPIDIENNYKISFNEYIDLTSDAK